jgi:hypothetical protein
MFVDGVVNNFPNAVVESGSIVRIPEVHPWPLANGL